MSDGYWQWVDRRAREIRDDLMTGRKATHPGVLPADVHRRLLQLLGGDETPTSGDPSDE